MYKSPFESRDFFMREHWNDPKYKRNVWIVIGLMFLSLAVSDFFSGIPESHLTGRWSWLYRGIVESFGPDGVVAFEALFGLIFIARAYIGWIRRNSSND